MDGHVTAVFGLLGFEVLAAGLAGGEWEILVETELGPVGCPDCGAVGVAKDRRPVWVRDLPVGGIPVVLCWHKRVFACRHAECGRRTWTETHSEIEPRAALTERARRWAFEQVGHRDRAVAEVAAQLGVAWGTIMTVVRRRGEPVLADPDRTAGATGIGVDETAFLRATKAHTTAYVTGIVDLTPGRPARLLDVVPGRSAGALTGWLSSQPEQWKQAITRASLDPFRGYASGLAAELPDAVRVLDPFHVCRLALHAVDLVRRRTQIEQYGHRGRAGDPLYRIRRLLLRRHDRLTPHAAARLRIGLAAADPKEEITAAWIVAGAIMDAYAHPDPAAGKALAVKAIELSKACPVPEVRRLARTLTMWRTEYLARFDHPDASNGRTENKNLAIKNTKRIARGFRNFANYRLRLLLNHGRISQDQPTARIRTRRPSLVA